MVSVLKVPALSGLEEPMSLTERTLGALVSHRLIRVHDRVDARDQRRERPQPRERFIVEDQTEQRAGRDESVPLLVRVPLTLQ